MTKRILSLLLVLVLALSLCACNSIKDLFGGTSDDPGVQDVDPNAPAHEQLMTEVNNRLVWAAEQADVGMTFQSEYLYGVAQAEISSLRLCIDTVLWLMGEGDNLSQVIGNAPYKDWDAIVGAGPGSAAPFHNHQQIKPNNNNTHRGGDGKRAANRPCALLQKPF